MAQVLGDVAHAIAVAKRLDGVTQLHPRTKPRKKNGTDLYYRNHCHHTKTKDTKPDDKAEVNKIRKESTKLDGKTKKATAHATTVCSRCREKEHFRRDCPEEKKSGK